MVSDDCDGRVGTADVLSETPSVVGGIVGMATEEYENGVMLDFSRPGKSTDNGFL